MLTPNDAHQEFIDAIKNDDVDKIMTSLQCDDLDLNHLDVTHDMETPLMLLCHSTLDDDDTMDAILNSVSHKRLDVNIQDTIGRTLAMHACIALRMSVLKFVLSRDPDVNICDRTGKNVFHYGACTGNDAMMDLLLQHSDADTALRVLDFKGYSPLDLARQKKASSIVKKISMTLKGNTESNQPTNIVQQPLKPLFKSSFMSSSTRKALPIPGDVMSKNRSSLDDDAARLELGPSKRHDSLLTPGTQQATNTIIGQKQHLQQQNHYQQLKLRQQNHYQRQQHHDPQNPQEYYDNRRNQSSNELIQQQNSDDIISQNADLNDPKFLTSQNGPTPRQRSHTNLPMSSPRVANESQNNTSLSMSSPAHINHRLSSAAKPREKMASLNAESNESNDIDVNRNSVQGQQFSSQSPKGTRRMPSANLANQNIRKPLPPVASPKRATHEFSSTNRSDNNGASTNSNVNNLHSPRNDPNGLVSASRQQQHQGRQILSLNVKHTANNSIATRTINSNESGSISSKIKTDSGLLNNALDTHSNNDNLQRRPMSLLSKGPDRGVSANTRSNLMRHEITTLENGNLNALLSPQHCHRRLLNKRLDKNQGKTTVENKQVKSGEGLESNQDNGGEGGNQRELISNSNNYDFEEEITLDTNLHSTGTNKEPRTTTATVGENQRLKARRPSLSLPDLRDMTGCLVTSSQDGELQIIGSSMFGSGIVDKDKGVLSQSAGDKYKSPMHYFSEDDDDDDDDEDDSRDNSGNDDDADDENDNAILEEEDDDDSDVFIEDVFGAPAADQPYSELYLGNNSKKQDSENNKNGSHKSNKPLPSIHVVKSKVSKPISIFKTKD